MEIQNKHSGDPE